jgi:hypothetical protein
MHFSSRTTALIPLAAASALTWADAPAPAVASLCTPTQLVGFSCALGHKVVSLCADRDGGRITSLAFRYGAPGRTELSYVARAGNDRRFHVTASPLAPRASVRQLWFTRGNVKYLLTQCVGGGCPQDAGLAVLRGEHVLSNRRCARSADDRAWFARELVEFGADADSTRSLTELVIVDDTDNGIEQLLARSAAPPH